MKPDHVRALLLRSKIADALGDSEAARLLRGFSSTLSADPRSIGRVRAKIHETVTRNIGPAGETDIAQVWKDALEDLGGAAPAKLAPPKAADDPLLDMVKNFRAQIAGLVEKVETHEMQIAKVRDDAAADVGRLGNEVATLAIAVSDLAGKLAASERRYAEASATVITLRAQVRMLEQTAARRSDVADLLGSIQRDLFAEARRRWPNPTRPAPTFSGPVIDRLRAHALPDGRTWLDQLRVIATLHGVNAEDVVSTSQHKPLPTVRAAFWRWLREESGAKYSYRYISRVWGLNDHSGITDAIARLNKRQLEAAPASGPRAVEAPPEELRSTG